MGIKADWGFKMSNMSGISGISGIKTSDEAAVIDEFDADRINAQLALKCKQLLL